MKTITVAAARAKNRWLGRHARVAWGKDKVRARRYARRQLNREVSLTHPDEYTAGRKARFILDETMVI